jgi:hypothetical protein
MFKTLVDFAAKVRTFLAFAALIVLTILALFLWFFSRGSFDPIVANFAKLDSQQFFWLVLVAILLIFMILVILIVLSFLGTRKPPRHALPKPGYPLFVTVHEDGDKTMGIEGAAVILALLPKTIHETASVDGSATFYFPVGLVGQKFELNARKEGYENREPINVRLMNSAQVFISLKREPVPAESPTAALVPEMRFTIDRVLPYRTERDGKSVIYGTLQEGDGTMVYGEGQRVQGTMENLSEVSIVVSAVDLVVDAFESPPATRYEYSSTETSNLHVEMPVTVYQEPLQLANAQTKGTVLPISSSRFRLEPKGTPEAQHTLSFTVIAKGTGLWRYRVRARFGDARLEYQGLECTSVPLSIVKQTQRSSGGHQGGHHR